MEEEIDLRAYVNVLLRYWHLILGLVLAAAVLGYVVSLLRPMTYRATAVVMVTQPLYQMQFDPRFETVLNRTPAYKAFPTLATSDGVLQGVLEGYTPSATSGIRGWSLSSLSAMVQATSEGDPSLVMLRVLSTSRQDAAAIANVWADVLVRTGNAIYGGSDEDVAFFEAQAAQAQQTLDSAQATLTEFEGRNRSSAITAELESQREALSEYLADQRNIARVTQDLLGLRSQLAARPGASSVSLTDALTALLLQVQGFGIDLPTPVQLQLDGNLPLSAASQGEQVALIDGLVDVLGLQSAEIGGQLKELEPTILDLQRQLEEITAERDRLARARDLARETATTLTRKVDETRIAAQEKDASLHIGSQAAVPEKPVGPRKLFNTGVAALVGLVAGIVFAFLLESRRQDRIRRQDKAA